MNLGVREGHWHVMDSDYVLHAWNRHGDAAAERGHGQIALSLSDFHCVPELIDPRNIVEFRDVKDTPRIAYAKDVEGGRLFAVQEVQRGRRRLVLKTLYKQHTPGK